MNSKSTFTLLLAISSVMSCTLPLIEDNKYVPPTIFELVMVKTDENGCIYQITNDQKERYLIADTAYAGKLFRESMSSVTPKPDKEYRMICKYEKVEDKALIHEFNYVYSNTAYTSDELLKNHITMKNDPLKVESIWIGGGYMNMYIRVNTLNKVHNIYVVQEALTPKLVFTLLHNNNDDKMGYFKNVCLSVPLINYNLTPGDSILFHCQGYGKEYHFSLVYK